MSTTEKLFRVEAIIAATDVAAMTAAERSAALVALRALVAAGRTKGSK